MYKFTITNCFLLTGLQLSIYHSLFCIICKDYFHLGVNTPALVKAELGTLYGNSVPSSASAKR